MTKTKPAAPGPTAEQLAALDLDKNRTFMGKVDNGELLAVDFGFYAGPAGVRVKNDRLELAVVAPMPRQLPETGTIEGDRVRVVSIAPSKVTAGFVVIVAE